MEKENKISDVLLTSKYKIYIFKHSLYMSVNQMFYFIGLESEHETFFHSATQ